jgi:hypothetical protein
METQAITFPPQLIYSLRAKKTSVTCLKVFTLLKRLVSNPGHLQIICKRLQLLESAKSLVLLTPLERETVRRGANPCGGKHLMSHSIPYWTNRQTDRHVLTKHAMLT